MTPSGVGEGGGLARSEVLQNWVREVCNTCTNWLMPPTCPPKSYQYSARMLRGPGSLSRTQTQTDTDTDTDLRQHVQRIERRKH